MRSNNLCNVGRPVPKAIIEQLRLRESQEYREALAKTGKRKLEILWAGIRSRGGNDRPCEFPFIFN